MGLQVNDLCPDFRLYNTKKEEVSLSSHRGQSVILLFFPFAFSSTCTAEMCAVRDSADWYANVNAAIYGISVDSLYTLARFRKEERLPFELLSDFNKEASTAYDCLYAQFPYNMRGVSKRAAFVIDAGGRLRYSQVLENAGLEPDYEKIKFHVAAAKQLC